MRVSRRLFLIAGGLGVVASAVRWLHAPPSQPTSSRLVFEPGPLTADELARLESMIDALLGPVSDKDHYLSFCAGAPSTCSAIARSISGCSRTWTAAAGRRSASRWAARRAGAAPAGDPVVRRHQDVIGEADRRARTKLLAVGRDRVRVRRGLSRGAISPFLPAEIFGLFATTDALLAIGYESWVGIPRGLEESSDGASSLAMSDEPEVVIVGTGIAGTTLAYLLTQWGHRVKMFEVGPPYGYPHLKQYTDEVVHLYRDPKNLVASDIRKLEVTGNYRDSQSLIQEQIMVVGGMATRWSAWTPRLLPSNFNSLSRSGYGEDLPSRMKSWSPIIAGRRRTWASRGRTRTTRLRPRAPSRIPCRRSSSATVRRGSPPC